MFLALCGLFSLHALAAPPKPASKKAPVKKPSAKSKVKKLAARIVHRPAPKPAPPSAEIPTVVELSSVWQGCLESQDVPKLATSFGMEPTRLATQLEEMGSSENEGGCIAYAAATGGDAGVASVIFQHTDPGGESRALAFHKTPDGIITTPGVCDCRESAGRVLNLPAREFLAAIDAASPPVPPNIRWQLNILIPRMISGSTTKEDYRQGVCGVRGRGGSLEPGTRIRAANGPGAGRQLYRARGGRPLWQRGTGPAGIDRDR